MYASIAQINGNKRVFVACLLSLLTLIAPIASVGAATRRATVPLRAKATKPSGSAQPSLVEPPAAVPVPASLPGPVPAPAPEPVFAVNITASKVDSFPDPDGDGKAELGEVITYSVNIQNSGSTDATSVVFNDTIDDNTTFVPGSMHASPIAFNDTYEWVGNTVLDTAARSLPSATANDVAITDTFTVDTQTNAATTQGGSVTLSSNGHFVYTPQLGDGGPGFSDTFTYTIRNSVDSSLAGTGTVTINMPVRVWYLVAGGVGDGRSLTPSGAPATISTSANLASDILYVYFNAATLNGAFTLDSGQTLQGEGVALVANSITLRPAGSTPTITNSPAGNAVTLGGSNLVTGLNISQGNGFAIFGPVAGISGTTNITGVGITNSGTGGGISLTNQTGTFNMTNSPISGTTSGTAVFVSGGAGNINFANSPVSHATGTGRLIDIQSKTGGNVVFNGGSTVTGTGITTDAIVLLNNTGVGTSFTFSNNVQVTTTTGRGVVTDNTSGSFILIMNAASNTISATGGAAVDVQDLAATTALAFTSISSTNSTAFGLRANLTAGTMSFGNATLNGSADTGALLTTNTSTFTFTDLEIAPDSGERGLLAQSNTGAITIPSGSNVTTTNATAVEITGANSGSKTPLNAQFTSINMTGGGNAVNGILLKFISSTGSPGSFSVLGSGGVCTFASSGTCSGGRITNTVGTDNTTDAFGVYLEDVPAISLTRMHVDNHSNGGIRGKTLAGFTLQTSVVDGNNGTSSNAAHDADQNEGGEDSVRLTNLTGSGLIDSCTIAGGLVNNLRVQNNAGTLNRLTVSNSFIGDPDAIGSGQRGIGTTAQGGADDVHIVGRDGFTTMNVTLSNNTINFGNSALVRGVNNDNTAPIGNMDIVLRSNTMVNAQPFANQVGASSNIQLAGLGNMTYEIACNKIANSLGILVLIFKGKQIIGNPAGNFSGTIFNNTIGLTGVPGSGGGGTGAGLATAASAINVDQQGTGTGTVLIKNNTIRRQREAGIRLNNIDTNSSGGGVSTLNATVIGNLVTEADTFTPPVGAPFANVYVNGGADPMTDGNQVTNLKLGSTTASEKNNITDNSVAPFDAYLEKAAGTFNLARAGSVAGSTAGVVADNNIADAANVFANAGIVLVSPGVPALPAAINESCSPPALQFVEGAPLAQMNLNQEGQRSVLSASQLSNLVVAALSGAVSAEPTIVNNALLQAKASVSSHRRSSTASVNPTTSAREEVRFAHARSNRPRNKAAVANPSFVAPLAPLTPLSIGTLPAGKTVIVKFQATVNTTGLGAATSVSNQGNVTYAGGPGGGVLTDDPAVGGLTDPTVTLISRLDVQVTKTDGVTTTTPGGDLTYTLTYTNNDHAANGVVLTETVPVGTIFKAAGSSVWTGCADGAPAGTVCTINLGNLPRNTVAGFTGTRTFVVTKLNPAPAGLSSIVNTATIAHDGSYEADINTANNTTTDTDTLNAAPDLNISKSDGVAATTPGSTLTYTINYSNVGNQNATGVVLTETVPVGTTYVAAGSSPWSCADGSPGGTTCTINVGGLTAGVAAASATFKVLVTNPAAAGLASIVNNASIADDVANGTDPTLPNTASDTDTLNAAPDLTISKVPDVTSVGPADIIVYTITYANAGTQNATGVVISETVPVHTTFSTTDSAPTVWSCPNNSPAATVCTTTIGGLAGGGSGGTVKFAVKVVDPIPLGATQISNTATIADDAGNGTDPTPANNTTGPVITPIIVCTPPPANMTNWWAGDGNARDIAGGKDGTLTNGATATGTGKVLQGFSFDGVDDYVDVGDVDFTTDKFTIDAWVNPTNLTSQRTIVAKDDGASSSYNFFITPTGELQLTVTSSLGTTIYKTGAAAVAAGSLRHVAVTYDGAAAAGSKVLFYVNGALVASTPTTDNGGTPNNTALAARIGNDNTGASPFLGVIDEVEFFSRVLAGSELLAIYSAGDGGKCKPSDLRITKSHTDPFVQGSTGNTYTITVTNDGPATTTGTTTVTENLPAGLTATAMSGGANWTCGGTYPVTGPAVRTCTSTQAVAAGGNFDPITLTVTAGANMASVINNVTVSGGGEMDTSDDSFNDTTNLTPVADLLAVKVDSPDPVTAGTNITYAVTLTNNGPSDAQTVTLTDTVPANTTFVSVLQNTGPSFLCTDPGLGGTGNVSCSIATLAAGATATFTIVVNVNANTPEGTTITNNAVAASATGDSNSVNNTGTATTNVIQSDIEITSKTDTPDPVDAGSNITYTVNFKNNSAVNTASNVTVTDAVPVGTTFVSATAPGGWTPVTPAVGGTGNIVFSKALVAGAETAVFTIVVKVDTNVANATTITNTATAATTSLDTVAANNSANTTTLVQVNADLQITSKTDLPDPVTASQNITYAINFVNNGPSDAQGVTITDAVPTGTTFVSAQVTTGTGWTIPSPPAVGGTGNVVFSKTTVATGESAVFEVVVKVDNNAVEGSIITNNAVAAGSTNDPTPGNNTGTATTTVQQSDIEITSKTDTPDPVDAGSNITYTVNFKNNSAVNTASNVTVTDAVPVGTTFVSATAPGGWTPVTPAVGGTGNIVFSKALVAGAETAVFTIVVKVDTNVANATVITNTATAATSSFDTVSANNSASATTTVQVNADLQITSKTDLPDPVTASQNITYAINFVNNGPSDAQGVTITDAVPTGTTFVSAQVTTGTGWTIPSPPAVGGTGNVVFSKTTVATGESAVFEVVVKVDNNAVEGSIITNNAVAAGTTNDPTPGNNTGTATTTVYQSDIEITSKTDAPDPVTAGQDITYTVNFKNNSAFNPASNVTVTDAIPTGTTLVSATPAPGWLRTDAVPVGGTGNIVFSKSPVSGSETAVFTIVVKVGSGVANGTVITNTATAATTSIDTNSANDSASTTTTVQVVADLEITSKTDTPDPVIASQNITYTVNFANNGPSDAQTVTVTDAVPANTTLVSATTVSPGWARSDAVAAGGTGNIVFAKATVPAGETASFTIVVQVNANAVEGSSISNTATAAGAVTDNTPANDSKTTTTAVNQSDIEITSKTDTPDPVTAGQNLTYTVNFKNNSANMPASDVTVTDAIPTGTTLVSATPAAGWARTDAVPVGGTGNIVFEKLTVAASETAVFTIVVNVNSSVANATVITNTATAATSSIDTNSANNSASTTTTVQVVADLEITSKTDTPDPVIASQNITYTVNFANNGPSDAQTVTVTDAVPANTTLVSATTVSPGWARSDAVAAGGTGNIVFAKATVPAGETASFTIVVQVNANAVEGSTITNTATAAGAVTDNTPANDSKTTTTTVNQSDIEITSKTDTPDPVTAGNNITYTVNFKNNSANTTASNVTVTDAVPAGTTLISATTVSPGWARTDAVLVGGTGNIVFSKALVAVSETAVFTIVVKVGASATTTVTNTATAATTSIDTNSANNSATATTTVNTIADLEITAKTDAPDPVIAGNNLTYTINLVNNGPSDAQTVTVTDGVPANTTFVSATLPAGWSRSDAVAAGGTGNLIFAKATVAVSETAIFTVVVKVNASTPVGTTLTNTATAASATTDNTPGNNAKTATTTVSTEADLLVVKVDSPDPVIAGDNLTYTITVTNNGVSDAQSVQLSDTLPASTTLVSFTVPGGWTRTDAVPVGGTGTVTATTPTLVVGGSAQFTLVVNVNASTPHNTLLTNSATVNSTTTDPNPANNTGTATTTVLSQPDLTITKTHSGNFSGGQVGASYTITVNNIGTGPTTAPVTVTDTVPVGLTPTGPNGVVNGWTCSINAQTLTCTRSDVLAGASSYPPIILTVNVANPAPLNVVNTATVSGGGEVNTANNTASDPTAINCSADFALNNTSPLMISRFRLNGPAGPQDEFVEIYNPSPLAHTVASGNCNGGGYGVYASAGNGTTSDTATLVCYIPNGTVIPAGGYYLCTGVTYSLNNLGLNGGAAGATATGDAPIGCGGTCGANIPDDAGLVLTNKAAPTVASPEGFGAVEFGEVVYDKVGFGPYGPAAPAPGYPSLSSSYCEGGAAGCLKPVGDASTGAACTNPSGQFPVVSTPPACYGLAGQYEFLRRQTTFSPTDGTIHQDTNNSGEDFILIAPNPATNMGTAVTGVMGVSAVLGAARPYNHNAPPDLPATKLTRSPFDGTDQLGPRNAERRFIPDPTIADLANNPLGTLVLRFKFTNNTGSPINVIRFETDNLSTLCGPQVAAPTTASVGTGDARNLSSTPGCGTGTFTAIFKALNSTSEIVVDGGGTAQFVNGTVMEDLSVGAAPGAGPLSPKGGGIDSTFLINPSSNTATVGDGVTGGVGNFSTVIGTTDPTKVLRVRVKFGVVRSGRFILLVVPMAKNSPAP